MQIKLLKLIQEHQIDPDKIIPILESGIEQEKLNLQANEILQNDLTAIESDQRITHCKILLSFLRLLSAPE
jgi:hypothetical protein